MSQTELRLVNVALASLEELLLDYEDFLHERLQLQWKSQQIVALEKQFVEDGGYTEKLAAKRLEHRQQSSPDEDSFPPCPQCSSQMSLRTIRSGEREGQQFLGCSKYPSCKGTRNL